METREFINELRAASGRKLLFCDDKGNLVQTGYHLTEIKAASYDTVDCGRETNRWNETIFQLWVPEDSDAEFMSCGKFIGIFDRVQSLVTIDLTASARVEYGDENFFPSIYSIESISKTPDEVRILLAPPVTTCKARDRRSTLTTEACCS